MTPARFHDDPTDTVDRLDLFMGVENRQSFLSRDIFATGSSRYNDDYSDKYRRFA